MSILHCPQCPYFAPQNEVLDSCIYCSMARTRTVATDGYDQDYRLLTDEARASRAAYFRQFIRRDLRDLIRKGVSLDIGCADGLFLDLLSQKGWQAFGVDPFAELKGNDSRISRTPIEQWDQETSFDLITMIHSLEHMEDPRSVLQKVQFLLKPNGMLLVVVPNYGGWWSRITGLHWPWLNTREHYYHYTISSLQHLLCGIGLSIQSIRTSSAEAPSLPTIALSYLGFFDKKYLGSRILASIVFRISGLLRRPVNWFADSRYAGAEIIMTARHLPNK